MTGRGVLSRDGVDRSPSDATAWRRVNLDVLTLSVQRIRLLLHRRILWLRQQWQEDPLTEYRGLVVSDERADTLLSPHADDEAAFYASDPEVTEIDQRIRDVEAGLADLRSQSADRPAALDELAELFGLSEFAVNTVLLGVGPEVDPELEPLYAYAQDDATRRHATPNLALALFCPDREDRLRALDALTPDAPLRRYRLLDVEDGASGNTFGSRALVVPERVQAFLRGGGGITPSVAGMLQPVPAAPLTAEQEALVSRLTGRLADLGAGNRPHGLNLLGPPGSGRRAIAEAVSRRLGRHLVALDVGIASRDPRAFEAERPSLEREGVLSRLAVYVDGAVLDDVTEPETKRSLISAIDRLDAWVMVGSTRRWPGIRVLTPSTVPKIDSGHRRTLWRAALSREGFELNGGVDALVHQFELGPSGIADAVRTARRMADLAPTDAPVDPDRLVWIACRKRSGPGLYDLSQRIEPTHVWDDIVLPRDTFDQLREIAAQVRLRTRVYETWGFGKKLNRGLGISALFSGPSGTGKTFAAEILAHEFDLALYRIDLSGVVSKYIGETEKNLRKVFDAAEDSGAVLFFDEADALFGKRTEVRDSHDRYANIEVNYLLQRMEDYAGLVIMATNMKSHLDPAFLRRLRFLVDFPFPDASLRKQIWEKSFPAQAHVGGVDYDALCRMTVPGGNIRNIALNAAFLAADDDTAIEMRHVYHAARREYEKIEKLVVEAEFGAFGRRVGR